MQLSENNTYFLPIMISLSCIAELFCSLKVLHMPIYKAMRSTRQTVSHAFSRAQMVKCYLPLETNPSWFFFYLYFTKKLILQLVDIKKKAFGLIMFITPHKNIHQRRGEEKEGERGRNSLESWRIALKLFRQLDKKRRTWKYHI